MTFDSAQTTWPQEWAEAWSCLDEAESSADTGERSRHIGRFLRCINEFLVALERRIVFGLDKEEVIDASRFELFRKLALRPKLNLEDPAKLKGYIGRVYSRILIEHGSKQQKRRKREQPPASDEENVQLDPVSPERTPLDEAAQRELERRLPLAIEQLPETEKMIVQLWYLKQASDGDIAADLQLSRQKVQRLRNEALKRLKELIKEVDA